MTPKGTANIVEAITPQSHFKITLREGVELGVGLVALVGMWFALSTRVEKAEIRAAAAENVLVKIDNSLERIAASQSTTREAVVALGETSKALARDVDRLSRIVEGQWRYTVPRDSGAGAQE